MDEAGARQRIWQADPGKALFGPLGPPILVLGARGVAHRMGFIEQDHAFEVCASPLENLLQARALVVALGPERRLGEEKDAARHADRLAERKGVERLDIDRKSAKRAPRPEERCVGNEWCGQCRSRGSRYI